MDEQYTQALCNWVATLEALPEDLSQAKRPSWWRNGMSLFAVRGSSARWCRGCRRSGVCEIEAGIPPATTRSAALGGGQRTATPLAGMGQQDDRGPPGGMAARCLPTWALDADTATVAG